MRRVILGLLLSLVSFAAHAACPGNPPTCGNPMMSETSGSVMYATAYGVKADGTTSDDVALKAAVDACAAKGGTLRLPPGNILMTGAGGSSIVLGNCHLRGVGVPFGGNVSPGGNGTMMSFTSATVSPFICGQSWGLSGINFYWPNNTTGASPIAPFMIDDNGSVGGTNACGNAFIDDVVFINPYQAFVQSNVFSWENFIISNSILYATKDFLALKNTGGSFVINNVLAGPGPWFRICPSCKASGGTNASRNASFIHALSGGGVNVSVTNINFFNWAHMALLDSGGAIGNSLFDLNLDGMRNIVDASSGGAWALQNKFSGNNSGCTGYNWDTGNPVAEGNSPCFNMGANSSLVLSNYAAGSSRGDMIRFSGGSVRVQGREMGGIGQAADGADYYLIHLTANDPNASIVVQDATVTGKVGDIHAHGIVAANPMAMLRVQNVLFGYFNDMITAPYAAATAITGNVGISTTGPSSVNLSGTGSVTWSGNQFDKPPLATVSACGTGATIGGTLRGTISTGSGTVNSCVLHLPITPYSAQGNGSCTFSNTTALITGGSVGNPPTWNLSSGANTITTEQLNFNCGSE